MVKEIGMAELEIPEGFVGNLTKDQEKGLQEMWEKFFDCCEKATGSGKGGGDGGVQQGGDEELDPQKAGIPKGDEAKDEAKKQEEQKALQDLLKEYGSDALRTSFWRLVKFDNPDRIMLRFLRARKWDVSRAIAMLAGCLKWRLDNGVEDSVELGDIGNGEKVEKFLEQQRSGKVYALGSDGKECPMCWINVAKHFTRGQPSSSMEKFIIFEMESFRLLMVPPNDKVVIFFNMTGFGLSNMDWGCILYLVKCLEAYFPESLSVMYIHNAPWIFSGIWKVLGPLLDPVVRSKIQFTKTPNDTKDRVPAERFPEDYKGVMTSKVEFLEPQEGENKLHEDKEERQKRYDHYFELAKEYEDVTRQWAEKGSDKVVEKRNILVKKLRIAQFEMEPYTRGKTLFHRDGTIDGQGIVSWLYKQQSGEPIRHIIGRRDCVAVYKRELKEIEEGSSVADAEKKSEDALNKNDWITLYGDEETARRIEGPRVDGQVPEEGFISAQSKITGGVIPEKGGLKADKANAAIKGEDVGKIEDGAAAAAAGGGAAAAAASNKFEDAEEAPKKEVSKAVDGDKKVDEKADTAEGGGAAATPKEEKSNPSNGAANGDKSSNGGTNANGPVSTLKEKTQNIKSQAADKVKSNDGESKSNGGGGFGRRLSKMFKPATA